MAITIAPPSVQDSQVSFVGFSDVIVVDLWNLVLSARDSIGDTTWWPHFGELRRVLDPDALSVAAIFGSHNAARGAGWVSAARNGGFDAVSLPRARSGEKGVDGLLQAWAISEMNQHRAPGQLTLVAGDGDHFGLLSAARAIGWRTTVTFLPMATSHIVRDHVNAFVDLTPELERLRFRPSSNAGRRAEVSIATLAGSSAIVGMATTHTR